MTAATASLLLAWLLSVSATFAPRAAAAGLPSFQACEKIPDECLQHEEMLKQLQDVAQAWRERGGWSQAESDAQEATCTKACAKVKVRSSVRVAMCGSVGVFPQTVISVFCMFF